MDISALSPFALSLIPEAPALARFVELIVHPPIWPPVKFTDEPVTSPSWSTKNLEELNTRLPFEPLINALPVAPIKKVGVAIVTELPLKCTVSALKSKSVPSNFTWPPVPTTENFGVAPVCTPRNIPASP